MNSNHAHETSSDSFYSCPFLFRVESNWRRYESNLILMHTDEADFYEHFHSFPIIVDDMNKILFSFSLSRVLPHAIAQTVFE